MLTGLCLSAFLIGVVVGWAIDRFGIGITKCECGDNAELKHIEYECACGRVTYVVD